MRDIKLVIFDLDGTLVDAYPAIISSFNYAMARLRYPKQSDLVIRKAVGRGDENLLKPFVNSRDLKPALRIYRRHHRVSLVKKSRLLPGARRVLIFLKKRSLKLAVASNRPTRFSWILIRSRGIEKYFDYVLCADKPGQLKPHPQILNQIMKRLQVTAGEVVYVGDMRLDALTGRRAKVKTVIVTTGSNTKQEVETEKPYRMIKKIDELLKYI